MGPKVLLQSEIPGIPLLNRGKVRDIYDLGEHLLIVASDRISAFDVVLPNGIPHKGRVLNQISAFWFKTLEKIVPHHFVTIDLAGFPASRKRPHPSWPGGPWSSKRPSLCGWNASCGDIFRDRDGRSTRTEGSICGIALPKGMKESAKLPEPIFTPSTKAEIGIHDENIDFAGAVKILGKDLAEQVRVREHPRLPGSLGLGGKQGHSHCRHEIRVRVG